MGVLENADQKDGTGTLGNVDSQLSTIVMAAGAGLFSASFAPKYSPLLVITTIRTSKCSAVVSETRYQRVSR